MKKLSKILALVVALTMLMSVSAFAATKTLVTGANGKTIDLSFAFTDTSANAITSVTSGSTFIIQVNFAGNTGGDPDGDYKGIAAYNLLIKYDAAKVQFTNKQAGLHGASNPTANAEFAAGIAYYGATCADGLMNEADWAIYEEGNLFRIRAKALADLTEADLAGLVEFVATATSTDGTKNQTFKIEDSNREQYTITVPAAEAPGPVVEAGTKKKAVTLAATEVTSGDFTYTNVAVFDGAYKIDLAEGESVSKAGVMFEGNSVKELNISTEDGASIEYKVLFYGISADDAAALGAKIQTYFEGMFLPEA